MSRLITALRTAIADAAHGQRRLFELQTGPLPADNRREAARVRQIAELEALPVLELEPAPRPRAAA